jgi:mevalonate kinase
MTRASAPGKIILAGEHAVVFGRPAIAVPVHQVQAIVDVTDLAGRRSGDVFIESEGVGLEAWLADLPAEAPLARIAHACLAEVAPSDHPAIAIRVHSDIPIASGLGSGAAVSVAVARALGIHFGRPLPVERISELAFEVDQLHHGTPSGIDNTVIAFERPVYFLRGRPPETMRVGGPMDFVIADTGRKAPTAEAVAHVRRRHEADPDGVDRIFDGVENVVRRARSAIEAGDAPGLGSILDQNQGYLKELGVSSPELDRLVLAARGAGAYGAKLSGGGMGGNIIAAVSPEKVEAVLVAVRQAGADRAFSTRVEPWSS